MAVLPADASGRPGPSFQDCPGFPNPLLVAHGAPPLPLRSLPAPSRTRGSAPVSGGLRCRGVVRVPIRGSWRPRKRPAPAAGYREPEGRGRGHATPSSAAARMGPRAARTGLWVGRRATACRGWPPPAEGRGSGREKGRCRARGERGGAWCEEAWIPWRRRGRAQGAGGRAGGACKIGRAHV